MSAEVPVSALRPGDRVVLDDGRVVTVSGAPCKLWSGAVVVRTGYASAGGPGWFDRRPGDLVALAAERGAAR